MNNVLKYHIINCLDELEKKGKKKQRSYSTNDQPERPLSRGGTLREQESVITKLYIYNKVLKISLFLCWIYNTYIHY